MLIKLPIIDNNKIIYISFKLTKYNNYFLLSIFENLENNTINGSLLKVIYSNNKGYNNLFLYFPLKLIIINNKLWTNYFFNISINSNFTYKFDFFFELNTILYKKYKYTFIFLDDLKKISQNIWKINNQEYNNYLADKNNNNLGDYIKKNWEFVNLITNMTLFIIYNTELKNINEYIKKYNIFKEIITLVDKIKLYKFNINLSNYYTIAEHLKYYKNTKIKTLKELIKNKYYFIKINDIKYILAQINDINNNTIRINEIILNFNKYEIYHYIPTLTIYDYYLFTVLFKCKEIYYYIFNYIDSNITINESNNIISYYLDKPLVNNLYYLINQHTKNLETTDFEILRSYNYNNTFFDSIVKKYTNILDIIAIIKILLNNYKFPIRFNKSEIEPIFDDILYISLWNYKKLININNENKIFLINEINQLLPSKVKLLYYNILKLFYQLFNNFDEFIYNPKFFHDNLYKNFIKIFFFEKSNTLNLLNEMLDIKKIKVTINNNFLLINLLNKINWNNIKNKVEYLHIIIKNKSIFFHDKLNKIIFNENYDSQIKALIVNPFTMFSFLNNENEFIKWLNIFDYKILQLFFNKISLSSSDINNLGTLIYYLYKIEIQNFSDKYYNLLINHGTKYNKIILYKNKININIKEYFKINFTLNFGILAKHLVNNIKLTYENSDSINILNSDNNKDINSDSINISNSYINKDINKNSNSINISNSDSINISNSDSINISNSDSINISNSVINKDINKNSNIIINNSNSNMIKINILQNQIKIITKKYIKYKQKYNLLKLLILEEIK